MPKINFQTIYRQSEVHITQLIVGLYALLALLILLQSVFSGAVVTLGVCIMLVVVFTLFRPMWALGLLAVYLPFETVLLKFVSDEWYVFARYFSEGLVYLIALVVFMKLLTGKRQLKRTMIDLPFVLFLITLIASAIIHFVPVDIALLGTRQIIRFLLVFFLVVYLQPSKIFIQKLTLILFGIVMVESALGIMQAMVGEPLDVFLLPSETRSVGSFAQIEGVQQFWESGSRVFATFGRYDRLGNFLYLFLIIAMAFWFSKIRLKEQKWTPAVFLLGAPALLLTSSRASWFCFIIGLFLIGVVVKKNTRVLMGFVIAVLMVVGYLGLSGLQIRFLTEGSEQSFTERFFESFSYTRFQGEYYGYGRVYWFVQTPLRVVTASPFFGFGPGQFGAGAAAALQNTAVYDELGLPFGVFGTEGFIDNNWFALWGETGTLGLVFYAWLYLAVVRYAWTIARHDPDAYTKALALAVAVVFVVVGLNAFTSTVFEIRTVAFYLWLYAGFVYVLGEARTPGVRQN